MLVERLNLGISYLLEDERVACYYVPEQALRPLKARAGQPHHLSFPLQEVKPWDGVIQGRNYLLD